MLSIDHPEIKSRSTALVDSAEQFGLQNIFALLVLFGVLESLIVLPTHSVPTLPAIYVSYHVLACCHVTLCSFVESDIHDVLK